MPYWRLFYHVVWSTAERAPLIGEDVAGLIEGAVRTICGEEKVPIHAIGFMPDHVHLAVSIPPSVLNSSLVGRIKGSTSHLINQTTNRPDGRFGWQSEYGVLSFGEKALAAVISYVEHQAQRHESQKLWPSLETTTDDASRL